MKRVVSGSTCSGKLLATLWLLALVLVPFQAQASTVLIDLTAFYADPTVTVAADGASAVIVEDPTLIGGLLSNDPGMGDPGIGVPQNLLSLTFTYSFTLGVNNSDNFYAKVFNGDTGEILADFLTESSNAGTIHWDLSGIASSISLLGLEFQLNSNDAAFDSFVSISNPYLETSAVPVPGTMILLGSGLVGLLAFRKGRHC